ncbi:MAG: DnaJ domain-containing protein [Planctomycetota bacterium]
MPDPDADNPFELLGMSARFDLDAQALQRAWLRRSAKLHPDRAGDDPDAARRLALVNRAKSTLDDPEARANALLAVLGGPAKDEDKSLPDGYLMEMFEIREEHASGDGATRARIERWGADRRARHERETARLFGALSQPPTDDELRAIRLELNAWRYIERFLAEPGLD